MQRFLDVTKNCKSVICARVSPDQKGQIVTTVRTSNPSIRTLAIGDGANDVPMIQRAHVGIGIYGEEGLQAVNASDFAIGKFRFLKKLLLVHGRWSARRIGVVICYMFYKNAVLVIPQFVFSFFRLASGQNFYVDYPLYQLYNLIYTAFPILAFGILDKDVSVKVQYSYPELYQDGDIIHGRFFTQRLFWTWMGEAIFQATTIALLCIMFFEFKD